MEHTHYSVGLPSDSLALGKETGEPRPRAYAPCSESKGQFALTSLSLSENAAGAFKSSGEAEPLRWHAGRAGRAGRTSASRWPRGLGQDCTERRPDVCEGCVAARCGWPAALPPPRERYYGAADPGASAPSVRCCDAGSRVLGRCWRLSADPAAPPASWLRSTSGHTASAGSGSRAAQPAAPVARTWWAGRGLLAPGSGAGWPRS